MIITSMQINGKRERFPQPLVDFKDDQPEVDDFVHPAISQTWHKQQGSLLRGGQHERQYLYKLVCFCFIYCKAIKHEVSTCSCFTISSSTL